MECLAVAAIGELVEQSTSKPGGISRLEFGGLDQRVHQKGQHQIRWVVEGPSFSLGTHHSQSHSVCCKKGETILPSRHIGATPCVTPHPLNLPFSGGKGYLLPRQGGQPLWKVHLYPLEGRTSAAKGPWEWTLAKQS